MAEWQVEEGIGEHRAVRIEHGHLTAARLEWPGTADLVAGQVDDAVLVSRQKDSRRGTLRFATGAEALIDGLGANASEGASIRVEVTRAAMVEAGRGKLARARPSDKPLRAAPTLAEQLRAAGQAVTIVRRFCDDPWEELMAEAQAGELAFPGGSLVLHPTPAMTLIDVDGVLAPKPLALAAVPMIALALRKFDLAGSIGIDFPTLPTKAERRKVDDALALALADWPHEVTAMNGFGFVQLVSRLVRPSILHRARLDPLAVSARLLMRRAERIDAPGVLLLTAPDNVRNAIHRDWEAELSRRTGRLHRWQIDNRLAPHGSFAQPVMS